MKRILIISPGYFPKEQPRAFRWTALAEYWANAGHEVHVLCTKHYQWPEDSKVNKVLVHRVGHGNLMDFFYEILGVKNRRDQAVSGSKQKKNSKNGLGKFLYQLNTLFWRRMYWPDGSCIWYFPAQRKARSRLNQQTFDVLISVSLPFTSHWLGLRLKKRFPELRWLVDIGDPFAFLREAPKNNHKLYGQLNFIAERKVLEQADAVAVTVEQAKDAYLDHFSGLQTEISIIPPLFVASEPEIPQDISFDENRLTLAYFGAFYDGIRSPLHFLRLLEAIAMAMPDLYQQLEICFFGGIGGKAQDCFKEFPALAHSFKLYEAISRPQALFLMQQTDILLNIGNLTIHQLPSKSVDYLASGKPILNISYHQEDPFQKVFDTYPAICNLFFEEEIISAAQLTKAHYFFTEPT